MNNKIIFLFCFLLSNVVFIHATTGTMCTVKRDASYAGFTQFSNDMEAYEKFFNKTFSECTASTSTIYYDSQTPNNKGDTKTACRLKRKEAYIGFTYLSNDMKLFEQIFQEKHPECGVGNNVDVHKQYPFKNKLLTTTTAAYNKKKICKLKHDISYVASTYYSNNMTKYENMFMEKFPGCLKRFQEFPNMFYDFQAFYYFPIMLMIYQTCSSLFVFVIAEVLLGPQSLCFS